MCGYVAILYSGLRRADLADEATGDADVDWFQEYKQSAIMAEIPRAPRMPPATEGVCETVQVRPSAPATHTGPSL
jgi:hypothetical protein